MGNWYNDTGSPLSSTQWLMAHHLAKLPERTKFAQRLAERRPHVLVDLGCGPGIWMELLDTHMPTSCRFVGLDADGSALSEARQRSSEWEREVEFQQLDIGRNAEEIPSADMYLAFNIFPYLDDIASFISVLKAKLNPGGCIVIRQYDGSMLRIGPMEPAIRIEMDLSLQAAVLNSEQFRHYDLDRVFSAIYAAPNTNVEVGFDTVTRVTPYPTEFLPYLRNTVGWSRQHISEKAGKLLDKWTHLHLDAAQPAPSYFSGTDLVAILS